MGDINKYFGGISYSNIYNYQNKEENVTTYVKYMVNRSLAMFKYHNLPDTIPHEELEKMLQCGGMAVWYKHENDLYIFNASLGGEGDVYNRPTKAVISNPALKLSKECVIDEECILMLNDSLAVGLIPMYQKYCTIINETDITMILATINKRVQVLLSANDDNTVQSAKKFISDIENGKLGVIAETKLFDSLKTNTVATSTGNNLQEVWELQQYLKASMYNEIGLNANFNMKKERLAVPEVEMNTDNLYPLVDDMLECRRKAIEKVNEMFGTDIEVEFNSSWDYRVLNGTSIHNTEEETTLEEIAEQGQEEPTLETSENIETSNEPKDESENETKDEPTNEPKDESENETTDEPVVEENQEQKESIEEDENEGEEDEG